MGGTTQSKLAFINSAISAKKKNEELNKSKATAENEEKADKVCLTRG